MNAIRQTALLNKRELENATPPSASWHADYRDTAWIYVGGLPLDLSEGDVMTIFSQFGNPTHLNLIRDKESGKSKGFGFLKYEDQRSCDLAVDNLGGADVLGRLLRVDHTRYKRKDGETDDDFRIDLLEAQAARENGTAGASDTESEPDSRRARKQQQQQHRRRLKEERELDELLALKDEDRGDDDQDPMRDYLIKQKTEEVERARERRHKHRHRHRPSHRDDGDGDDYDDKDGDSSRAHRRYHHRRHRRREEEDDNDDNDYDHDDGDRKDGKRERRTYERSTSRHGKDRRDERSRSRSRLRSSSRRRSASPPRRNGR